MLKKIIKELLSYRRIGVFSHERPDGDAIGSQIALTLWLQKNGVEAIAFNQDEVPANIKWLEDYLKIIRPKKELIDQCDAFVFIDGNRSNRFGELGVSVFTTDKPRYLIDHHPDPDRESFKEMYSVVTASSSAELVYHVYEASDPDLIDEAVAKAIYTGIMTDTGSFRFESVTPEVHLITADLLRRGDFRPNEIHEKIYDDRTPEQMRLLGMALETVETYADGQIGTITITDKMLRDTHCTYADTEGFVSYPLSLMGTRAAVLFCELEGRVKLSLRTKSGILANVWARLFGGGGHDRAAGAWHNGPLEIAKKEVIEAGMEQLASLNTD